MDDSGVRDFIRQHLLESLGLPAHDVSRRLPDLPELRETEWCQEFEQLRRNRMVLAAIRYGRMCEPEKWKSDAPGGRLTAWTSHHRLPLDADMRPIGGWPPGPGRWFFLTN